MEIYKDIKFYKSSNFKEYDKFEGNYTLEVRGPLARVRSQELFGQLRDEKSRFAKLHPIGGSSGGGEPSVRLYKLRVSGQYVYFKIIEQKIR